MSNRLLFQPIAIKGMGLRNRIVMPPMVSNTGIVTDAGVAWYRERARGGVGLVIVEAAWLDRFTGPEFAQGLAALVRVVKDEGAAIAIQLYQPPDLNGEPVAVGEGDGTRALTVEEIRGIIQAFAYATRVCREAGFDGVEPHGAHGFLLNQFFSPRFNRRADEYGGSLENRMRLGLEVVRAVREAAGEVVVLYRHTPAEDAPGGYPIEDTLAFAPELVRAGVDVLDVSPSRGRHGEHAERAAIVKRCVSVPVIAVGGMRDPDAAEAALHEGKCDLVAVGRQLIADPYWPAKVREGRVDEVLACDECSRGCFGALRKGVAVGCVKWVGKGPGDEGRGTSPAGPATRRQ